MVNMGLSDLVVVSPKCDLADDQAQGFAARAKWLLARARIVGSVAEALEGCVLTFAASAKAGMYRRQAAVAVAEAAELAVQRAVDGPVAFAFGPEDRGLRMPELLSFDRVVEIPADPAYPVLNLAAAAVVVCYELRRVWLRAAGRPPWPRSAEPLATNERKRVLYAKLFEALERVGFFGGQQNPDHLKYALRRVFGRVDLTVNEVDVLIGMAQQIRWYVEHRSPSGSAPP
jgi:TrmH family RNA methyltransferase